MPVPRAGFLLLAILLALTGCGEGDRATGRVVVLGLDGVEPQVVDLLMSEASCRTSPSSARTAPMVP